MRCPLFAAVSAVAVLTAAASVPAAAQDYPYCLQGRDWGYPGLCHYGELRTMHGERFRHVRVLRDQAALRLCAPAARPLAPLLS